MAKLPALEKLRGTVETLIKVADGVEKYDMQQLNQAEDKIRNEFQVVEAALMYVGQEFHQAVMVRRDQLRRESIASIDDILTSKKEEDGTRDSGGNGDSGVGDGTDESSGAEQQSDKQTRKPARQSRRKK